MHGQQNIKIQKGCPFSRPKTKRNKKKSFLEVAVLAGRFCVEQSVQRHTSTDANLSFYADAANSAVTEMAYLQLCRSVSRL